MGIKFSSIFADIFKIYQFYYTIHHFPFIFFLLPRALYYITFLSQEKKIKFIFLIYMFKIDSRFVKNIFQQTIHILRENSGSHIKCMKNIYLYPLACYICSTIIYYYVKHPNKVFCAV